MEKLKSLILSWLPAIVWMLTIFYFSSQPHFTIASQHLIDFVIFKSFHMIEYGFLFFLLFRAIFKTAPLSPSAVLVSALITGLAYAIFDEYHQSLVPTREGKIRDVIIDMIGMLVVYWYIKSRLAWVSKYLI